MKYVIRSYNMGMRDLPDIAIIIICPSLRATGQRCRHIYQENSKYLRYNDIYHFRHSRNLPKPDDNSSADIYSNTYMPIMIVGGYFNISVAFLNVFDVSYSSCFNYEIIKPLIKHLH